MSREYKVVAVSLHPTLLAAAKARAIKLGFATSFSAYVAKLIREDVEAHPIPTTTPPEVVDWLEKQGFIRSNETQTPPSTLLKPKAPPPYQVSSEPPAAASPTERSVADIVRTAANKRRKPKT